MADVPRGRRHPPARPRARVRGLPRAAVRAVHEHGRILEDAGELRQAIEWVPGIDADQIIAAASDPATEEAFVRDRDEARTAANSPTEFQDKHANTDGRVRYTAPSLKLRNQQGVTLEAGGFQSFEAYDVLVANLDQTLSRRAPAEDAAEVLHAFPDGLTTAEVAQIMTQDKYTPDLDRTEDALITATGDGPGAPPDVRPRRAVGPERAGRARAGGVKLPAGRSSERPAVPSPTGWSSTA